MMAAETPREMSRKHSPLFRWMWAHYADIKSTQERAGALNWAMMATAFAEDIRPDGLFQDRLSRLLVPLRNAKGEVWNVQTINPDGSKFFLAGRKAGQWHMLGNVANGAPLGIAEGAATAATVREAIGMPMAVAFDSGNLPPVTRELRALYPASRIIEFGDDDRFLPLRSPPLPNVGRERAIAAAEAVGGAAVFPVFASDEAGTDFNDYAACCEMIFLRQLLLKLTSERPILAIEKIIFKHACNPVSKEYTVKLFLYSPQRLQPPLKPPGPQPRIAPENLSQKINFGWCRRRATEKPEMTPPSVAGPFWDRF